MQGFSLLELVIVMAVLAMVSVAAVPPLTHATDSATLEVSSRDFVNTLRSLRRQAMRTGAHRSLHVDPLNRSYRAGKEGPFHTVAPTITMKVVTPPTHGSASTGFDFDFFEDGSSSGGTVEFRNQRRRRIVEVDWLTGRVTTHE